MSDVMAVGVRQHVRGASSYWMATHSSWAAIQANRLFEFAITLLGGREHAGRCSLIQPYPIFAEPWADFLHQDCRERFGEWRAVLPLRLCHRRGWDGRSRSGCWHLVVPHDVVFLSSCFEYIPPKCIAANTDDVIVRQSSADDIDGHVIYGNYDWTMTH